MGMELVVACSATMREHLALVASWHQRRANEESYTRRVFFIASTDQPDYRLDEEYLAPIIVDDGT